MPADAWTAARERALLDGWRDEVARAMGGVPEDGSVAAVLVAGMVTTRSMLADLDALERLGIESPLVRTMTVASLVQLARYARALGLTRGEVRRLDLGRRRRSWVEGGPRNAVHTQIRGHGGHGA